MNTAEQLENMISSDVELGTIGNYKEEVAVWDAIFSSLYSEELNQAANDDILVEVYSYIREGVLETIRAGIEYTNGEKVSQDLSEVITMQHIITTTKSNWLELADQAELRLDWQNACHCYGKAIMLSNSEPEKSLLMFDLKEATNKLNSGVATYVGE